MIERTQTMKGKVRDDRQDTLQGWAALGRDTRRRVSPIHLLSLRKAAVLVAIQKPLTRGAFSCAHEGD